MSVALGFGDLGGGIVLTFLGTFFSSFAISLRSSRDFSLGFSTYFSAGGLTNLGTGLPGFGAAKNFLAF